MEVETTQNDVVAFSYLANKPFKKTQRHFASKYQVEKMLTTKRSLETNCSQMDFSKELRKEFSIEKIMFYQGNSSDNSLRNPHENAFKGQGIYLLTKPKSKVSVASLFCRIGCRKYQHIVGQETVGGYYGHNGHTPMAYILPNNQIQVFNCKPQSRRSYQRTSLW
jgi:hypothetical protein